MTYQQTLLSYYFVHMIPNWLKCYYWWCYTQWVTERLKPFNVMIRKMAVKIKQVELEDIISSWKNHPSKQQVSIFFNNRVVNNWNSLSFDVISATSINSFKIKLDKCWQNKMYVAWKNKLYAFQLLFFRRRLLGDLCMFYLCPVWRYLRSRFGTLFAPGVEHFCGDI